MSCLVAVGAVMMGGTVSSRAQMIDVDHGRKLSLYCTGDKGAYTVVLMAGGGRTLKDWVAVQSKVSETARVCSYDRAGLGDSASAGPDPQSADAIASDLHTLLEVSGETRPVVLVAHSIAGIYARRYVTRYPGDVAGLVFVDSSHEEQVLRLQEVFAPEKPDPRIAGQGFLIEPGQHSTWQTTLPMVVLASGRPLPVQPGTTEAQMLAWAKIWRGFQKDLASRSTHGSLRIAEQSGHFIHTEQPEMVIQAIRDVSPK